MAGVARSATCRSPLIAHPCLKSPLPLQMPALDARLTPAMRDVLERVARRGHPPLHQLGVDQARLAYRAASGVLEVPKVELAEVVDITIAARDGARLPARVYRPHADASRSDWVSRVDRAWPALLYLHGGGFTIGDLDTHDILCRELSRLTPCVVLSLDYRRAPEHRFPTAVLDTQDALAWMLRDGPQSLGIDATRVAIGGDSAGGTLAAVGAALARESGWRLALQLLIYPGCAAHADTDSHRRFAQGPILDARQIQWFFEQYIASSNRTDWRFAPLHLDDAEGLAPAWFGLAEIDPLVDEGLLYADKLRAAGVAVGLELYRGVTHEFIKMGRVLPEARRAHQDAALALAQAFGIHSTS